MSQWKSEENQWRTLAAVLIVRETVPASLTTMLPRRPLQRRERERERESRWKEDVCTRNRVKVEVHVLPLTCHQQPQEVL